MLKRSSKEVKPNQSVVKHEMKFQAINIARRFQQKDCQ